MFYWDLLGRRRGALNSGAFAIAVAKICEDARATCEVPSVQPSLCEVPLRFVDVQNCNCLLYWTSQGFANLPKAGGPGPNLKFRPEPFLSFLSAENGDQMMLNVPPETSCTHS